MKSFLIIGIGEFGKHLAYKLQEMGNEVCIVDSNKSVVDALSNDFENIYIVDCMNIAALKDFGVPNYHACIVAIGQNFQASLEITSHLKDLGAKYIISKANSDIQAKFLRMAGANEIVYPESETGIRMAKNLAEKIATKCDAQNLLDYLRISSLYSIYEVEVPKSWIDKNLLELNVRRKLNINVIAVLSNNEVNFPNAEYVFKAHDHVYIFGNNNIINKLK